ncbi:dihydroxyacetone kinase subunit DhaL [Acidothermaceae bacterium B102]|nr:dihydroxyacetone kinase subunit DhaL [Acidothermaceae bacterium B102]
MADGLDVTVFTAWVRGFADSVASQREALTALDSAIGDADHGSNMDRGLQAAVAAIAEADPATPGALLSKVGMTLVSTVGGASGPLYGTLFLRVGGSLGSSETVTADQLAVALRAGLDGVVARGKAELGDKTMVDALTPSVDALDKALADGQPLATALAEASAAADAGRDATTPLLARKGRASYLGERSIGHQDPGATSTALLVAALAAVVSADVGA